MEQSRTKQNKCGKDYDIQMAMQIESNATTKGLVRKEDAEPLLFPPPLLLPLPDPEELPPKGGVLTGV